MIDLEDLRRKAEAATPGEWSAALHFGPKGFNVYPEYGLECGVRVCHVGRAVDAKYIAAANPATILALIAEIERRDTWSD